MRKSYIPVFICLMLITLIGGSVLAESSIIYGEKHVFSIDTPDNWLRFQDEEEASQLPYLIRPADPSDMMTAYIYAVGYDKPEGSSETIKDFINTDIKNFENDFPDIKAEKRKMKFKNLKKSDMLPGVYFTYEFSGFRDETYKELVVYIDFTEGVCVLVYSAKTEESYNKFFEQYINFVESFIFIANNFTVVNMDK